MPSNSKTFGRTTQRSYYPGTVHHRNIASTYIRNTEHESAGGERVPYEFGTASVPTNSKLIVRATYTAGDREDTIIGTAPPMMMFFLTNIAYADSIPWGGNVAMTDATGANVNYQYYAPTALPDILNVTTEKNVVVQGGVLNVSGSTQTIYVYTQARLVFGTQVKRRQGQSSG